jgi:DNA-binding CsgD family transcriptional regulator
MQPTFSPERFRSSRKRGNAPCSDAIPDAKPQGTSAGISLEQFGRWSQGLAAAAQACSTEEISATFTAAASGLLACDRAYVGLYLRDNGSVTIDDRGPDPWNRNYDARLYRQDPFFRMFASTRQDFLLPLAALDTGDFQRTDYYRDFYEPSRSFDEITGVFNLDARAAGYITFLRFRGAPAFGADDLALAEAISGATRLVLTQLWHQWRAEQQMEAEHARSALRLSRLSMRERQIADLLIDGGSAKSISRSLAISPGTVRNHIKKVYAKLGCHSQVELMAAARAYDMVPMPQAGIPLTAP